MSRVSQTQLARLADTLSPRRWEILKAVASFRLISGGQIRRSFYFDASPSGARLARLDLAALTDLAVLHRLDRRIGGVRAGSSGYVYGLGPVGRRLFELRRGEGLAGGRGRYEPTVGFVDHALAVTEVWVDLQEYLRDPLNGERGSQVISFDAEREAWRTYPNGFGGLSTLKPDAELCILRDDYEDVWWLEVDRATERRAVIRQKLEAYLAYYRSGREQHRSDVFPLIGWLTTTEPRRRVLTEVIAELPWPERRLFRVGLLTASTPFLLSQGRSES